MVRVIRPAPVNTTSAKAISATSKLSKRRRRIGPEVEVRPPSLKAAVIRVDENAGTSPNKRPVNKVSAAVNSNTRLFKWTSATRGKLGGASLIRADNNKRAKRAPAKPPCRDSSKLSLNNWRIKRHRPDPDAILIPISCCRTIERASNGLAQLPTA